MGVDIIGWLGIIFGGTSIVGWVGSLFYFRQRMKKENLSVQKEEISTTSEAMELLVKVQGILETKIMEITKLQDVVDKNQTQIREQKWTLTEMQRKMVGMQRVLNGESAKKLYAEKYVCFRQDCEIRKPKLGEYSSPPCQDCK